MRIMKNSAAVLLLSISLLGGSAAQAGENCLRPLAVRQRNIEKLYREDIARIEEEVFQSVSSIMKDFEVPCAGGNETVEVMKEVSIERPLQRRRVIFGDNLGFLGGTVMGDIFVDRCIFDPASPAVIEFAQLNPGMSAPSLELLKVVLYHEYGHKMFNLYFWQAIARLGGGTNTEGVSEGFAYWFEEELSKKQSLTEEMAQKYSTKGASPEITRFLKYTYSRLKDMSSRGNSVTSIFNNVVAIIGTISPGEEIRLMEAPKKAALMAVEGSV
ncbi:MAG: hypothetical protein WCG78_07615 [Candidatus Omnitrophota bacterium]